MKVKLYNCDVEIDDNILNEVDIYNEYVEISNQAVREFVRFYNSASGIGEVISRGRNITYNQYREVVKHTISLCANNGVFGLAEDEILSRHGSFSVVEALSSIEKNHILLNLNKEAKKPIENKESKIGEDLLVVDLELKVL